MLAVPKGGIPVGVEVAHALRSPLDLVLVRKLPLPWEPEAGFGAVTEDGAVFLNDPLVRQAGLSPHDVQAAIEAVRSELARRAKVLREADEPRELAGRTALVVDDGLASGYTMLAAIASAHARRARRVVVAVPCGSSAAIRRVRPQADDLFALARSDDIPFAVASFYESFPEIPDSVAIEMLSSVARGDPAPDATGDDN